MLSRWLRTLTVLPPNVSSSYVMFVGYGSNRRKGCSIVWLAFVWALWKCRNDYIFNNKVANAADLFNYIQRLSWKWYMSSVAKGPCLLYEWVWNPGECMLRWWDPDFWCLAAATAGFLCLFMLSGFSISSPSDCVILLGAVLLLLFIWVIVSTVSVLFSFC
jgi:hypothetical protein